MNVGTLTLDGNWANTHKLAYVDNGHATFIDGNPIKIEPVWREYPFFYKNSVANFTVNGKEYEGRWIYD